jgi:hypothetical protein
VPESNKHEFTQIIKTRYSPKIPAPYGSFGMDLCRIDIAIQRFYDFNKFSGFPGSWVNPEYHSRYSFLHFPVFKNLPETYQEDFSFDHRIPLYVFLFQFQELYFDGHDDNGRYSASKIGDCAT